jgi:hypothetical protein
VVTYRVSRIGQPSPTRKGAGSSGRRPASSIWSRSGRRSIPSAPLRNPPQVLYGVYDGPFPAASILHAARGSSRLLVSPRLVLCGLGRQGGAAVPRCGWSRRSIEWARSRSSPGSRVVDFDPAIRTNLPPLEEREYASLRSIAKESTTSTSFGWARRRRGVRQADLPPLRPRDERSLSLSVGPAERQPPDDFIAAWIHVHQVLSEDGRHERSGCPLTSRCRGSSTTIPEASTSTGSASAFQLRTIASWSRWWSFHQILGSVSDAGLAREADHDQRAGQSHSPVET